TPTAALIQTSRKETSTASAAPRRYAVLPPLRIARSIIAVLPKSKIAANTKSSGPHSQPSAPRSIITAGVASNAAGTAQSRYRHGLRAQGRFSSAVVILPLLACFRAPPPRGGGDERHERTVRLR